jgi:hypothetical protein
MLAQNVGYSMVTKSISPGPAAADAFRLGMILGGVVGLAGIGLLYWVGTVTPLLAVYVLLAIFPVYLVAVAVALSLWLGYDKDATALRPVYRPKNPK